MGQATPAVLASLGVLVQRVDRPEDLREEVDAAARFAFDGHQAVAVLLSQRLLGSKAFR